jgi:hypothetical protein
MGGSIAVLRENCKSMEYLWQVPLTETPQIENAAEARVYFGV